MPPLFFYNLYVTNNLTTDTVIASKVRINKQKRNILPHLPNSIITCIMRKGLGCLFRQSSFQDLQVPFSLRTHDTYVIKVVSFLRVLRFPPTGNGDSVGYDYGLTYSSKVVTHRDQIRVIGRLPCMRVQNAFECIKGKGKV